MPTIWIQVLIKIVREKDASFLHSFHSCPQIFLWYMQMYQSSNGRFMFLYRQQIKLNLCSNIVASIKLWALSWLQVTYVSRIFNLKADVRYKNTNESININSVNKFNMAIFCWSINRVWKFVYYGMHTLVRILHIVVHHFICEKSLNQEH